jgi:hypothetical protein
VKDRDKEKEAETGVLSIEARAMCAIGGTSPVRIRYSRHGGAVLWDGSHGRYDVPNLSDCSAYMTTMMPVSPGKSAGRFRIPIRGVVAFGRASI